MSIYPSGYYIPLRFLIQCLIAVAVVGFGALFIDLTSTVYCRFQRYIIEQMWGSLAGRVADSVKDVNVRGAMNRIVDVVAPEIDDDDDDEEKDPKPAASRGLIGLLSRVIPQEEDEYEEVYEEVYEEEEEYEYEVGENDDNKYAKGDHVLSTNLHPTPVMNRQGHDDWLPIKPPAIVEPPYPLLPTANQSNDEWLPNHTTEKKKEPKPPSTDTVPLTDPPVTVTRLSEPKQRIDVPNRSITTQKTASSKLVVPSVPTITVREKKLVVPTKKPPPPVVMETKLSKDPSPLLVSHKKDISKHPVVEPPVMTRPNIPVIPVVESKPPPTDAPSPMLQPTSIITTETPSPMFNKKKLSIPLTPSPRQKKPLVKKESPYKQKKATALEIPLMRSIDTTIAIPKNQEGDQTGEVDVTTSLPRNVPQDTMVPAPNEVQQVPPPSQTKENTLLGNVPSLAPHQTCVEPLEEERTPPLLTSADPVVETNQPIPAMQRNSKEHHSSTKVAALEERCKTLEGQLSEQVENRIQSTARVEDAMDYATSMKVNELEQRCKTLERQLENAEQHIVNMQLETAKRMDEEDEWRQELMLKAKHDEARLMEASSEMVLQSHQNEMNELRESLEAENRNLREKLEEENSMKNLQLMKLQRQCEEAEAKARTVAAETQNALSLQNASSTQQQQRQQQTVRLTEDKLAQTLAMLDDKSDEVENLKTVIKELKATVMKNQEGTHTMERELDELRKENEILHHNIEVTEEEQEELQKQLEQLEGQGERTSQLQLELQMLKETRDRELAKSQSTVADVTSHKSSLETERNAALARAQDLDQQLQVALADVEVARSDLERAMISNANLQRALESFQSEREAELAMLEELRHNDEEATAASHAAAIQATHEANESKMRKVKLAADAAIKKIADEMQTMQKKVEECGRDNLHLRRSLDEAIYRLQSTQEDVVDRTMMKNILLDWFTNTGRKKEILELMASLLHFSDSEKEKCSIYEGAGSYEKFVGAVVAPLPAPAKELDQLEGDNVREKWVNFLLAETDDL